jgi:hypothetical protein
MLPRRQFLGIAGAALALPRAALAEAITVSPAGLIFLTIEVNGHPARALVDSGSVRGLQLSGAFAGAIGLALADSGQKTQRYQGGPRAVLKGQVGVLALAGAALADVEANVSPGDIEAIAGQIGETFDAILGWPLLSRQPFVIDYPARDLRLEREAADGLALPLVAGKPLPVVEGTLDGKPVSFLVDTGAPWCNADPSVVAMPAGGPGVDLPFTIGGKDFSATFRIKDLSAMSRGLGAKAVIGHRFLERFRLAWDPEGLALRLI